MSDRRHPDGLIAAWGDRETLGRPLVGLMTLLYAARDRDDNHAMVLRDYLRERLEAAADDGSE